jgi:hypothetical protein
VLEAVILLATGKEMEGKQEWGYGMLRYMVKNALI